MKNRNAVDPHRRTFLRNALPACTMACFGLQNALASPLPTSGESPQGGKHKFDEQYEKSLTYRQLLVERYQDAIAMAMGLKVELGDEKAISLLKKITTQRWIGIGHNHAKESPDDSFFTYTNTFRDKNQYKNTLTMEIVDDTAKAFELKVTECIWATTFLQAKAGDIGYAWVCFGDYTWAEAFNPRIKMVRDKTLMQGHDYCNHRYLWTG